MQPKFSELKSCAKTYWEMSKSNINASRTILRSKEDMHQVAMGRETVKDMGVTAVGMEAATAPLPHLYRVLALKLPRVLLELLVLEVQARTTPHSTHSTTPSQAKTPMPHMVVIRVTLRHINVSNPSKRTVELEIEAAKLQLCSRLSTAGGTATAGPSRRSTRATKRSSTSSAAKWLSFKWRIQFGKLWIDGKSHPLRI